MKRLAMLGLAAAISFHLPAMAEDKPDAVVAKIANVEIHESELALAESNIDPQLSKLPPEQRRIAALTALIDSKILAAKAKAEALDQSDVYKMRMKFLEDRELHNAYFKKHIVEAVTDAELKARYDKEVAAMPKQEEVHARHILVKTEDEAKAVIAALDSGKDFAELAKDKSTDPNKSDGGDLGFFHKGQMVPEFETAAFALDVGTYSKTPVKTQFGFHVIKVEEKRPVAPPEFDKIKDQVRQVVMRDNYLAMLATLKAESNIDVIDPELKKAYDEANKASAK